MEKSKEPILQSDFLTSLILSEERLFLFPALVAVVSST